MGHHHSHHHHASHFVRETEYKVEPVTLRQKRVWRIKGIIWTVLAGIIVVASIVLAIVFSVIDSKLHTGLPFLVMPAFAGVPLAFAIPYMQQGYRKKPQEIHVYSYDRKVVPITAKVECPKCNAENEFGSTNCKECGETLPQRCPICGADIIPNDEACRDCGLALQ